MGEEMTLRLHVAGAAIACLSLSILLPVKDLASEGADAAVGAIVAAVITPVMRQYGVPGTAVEVFPGGHEYVEEPAARVRRLSGDR
jgi:hypothetical protein